MFLYNVKKLFFLSDKRVFNLEKICWMFGV